MSADPIRILLIEDNPADATLVGESNGDQAGQAVAGGGDVDGDGYDDLFVGADQEDSGGSQAGAAYLVRGPLTGRNLTRSIIGRAPGIQKVYGFLWDDSLQG